MYLSLFSLYFSLAQWSVGTVTSTIRQFFFLFFFCWLLRGLDIWPRFSDPSLSQNPREFCASHFSEWICMVKFNFLHNFHWITLPSYSCLVLHSLGAILLHSLITWLIVSSLSTDNLLFFLCLVYSRFDIVLMALFCADVRKIQFLS